MHPIACSLTCTLLATLSLLVVTPVTHATTTPPLAKLEVTLTPEHLGAGTTIIFNFTLAGPSQSIPPPLTRMELLYPAGIGLVTSGLGLETCTPTALETLGPAGCPADSLMGYGTALAKIPLAGEIYEETGHITTYMAPVKNGRLRLLFDAEGSTPVSAQVIFTAQLLPAPQPYGGNLSTDIPLVPTVPEGPDVSVVHLHATIGPKDITYYQYYHGKRLTYHPIGLRLPETCPHHGFPFATTFTFLNGTRTTAHTTVPCPRSS